MSLDLSIPTTATMALVVEDPLTRDYLRAVWENPIEIAFVLGGGNDGVHAIVKSFREEGYPNVFGVTDRDFRPSNRADWHTPTRTFRTFVLPVHEVENYLLDARALQASPYQNRGLDITAIENQMRAKAGVLCWWAACRETLDELKQRFREPFPSDPSQAVTDEFSALAYVCESVWFRKLADEAARSTVADVHARLVADHAVAADRLHDGSWRQEFAGKEIIRDVAGWMCDQTGVTHFPPRKAEFYSDLAKWVAAWQTANGAVPADLIDLRAALRERITRFSSPTTP